MSSKPRDNEFVRARQWCDNAFLGAQASIPGPRIPISFRYGGRDSRADIENWTMDRSSTSTDQGYDQHTLVLADPGSGLQVRVEVKAFRDFPAVEWVAYLKNTGDADTATIDDIRALDVAFPAATHEPSTVLYSKGSSCQNDDFEPRSMILRPRGNLRLESVGGRSSNGTLPFFSVAIADRGIIGAIGWSGGWAATISRDGGGRIDEGGAVHLTAGQQRTSLVLRPGEEIRAPSILLLFWDEDPLHGNNMLRQLILAHHTPRPNGELIRAPIGDPAWGDRFDSEHIAKARWIRENNLPIEYYWIDAGWYGDSHAEGADTFGLEWVREVGNWFPNKITYPDGLKTVGNALKELNLGFVLWVEPERVYRDTLYAREHPEWLLGPISDGYLFNLGIPEARRHVTDAMSKLIDEGNVTCLRVDFNMNPGPYLDAADAPNRIGMGEIRYVEGLYAMWDELLERHPGLIIDNCSSGGRRIDLETISRSIALWRSDVQCYPNFSLTAMQNQGHGLSLWVPLSTGCGTELTTYAFRSAMGPGMVVPWAERGFTGDPALRLDWCQQMLADLLAVRDYFYGDFYPLVEFSLNDDSWTAWQFDRPDLSEGMILALRRPLSPFPRLDCALRGLDPDATYEIHWRDHGERQQVSGRTLLDEGIALIIGERPGSELLTYRKV